MTLRPLVLPAAIALLASTAPLAQAETQADGQWRGTAGAAASMTSGNSSTSTLAFNVDLSRATASDKASFGGNANYGRSKVDGESQTNANKWAAFGEYDYNLSTATYVFGKLGLEGDKVSKLDLRSTVATGVGYKLIDTKALSFSLFGGLGYSVDKYSEPRTIGDKTDTRFSRSSLMLGEESSHQFSDSTSFKQRLEAYPGLSGDKATLLKFTSGLSVAISSTLSLTVALTDTYNSKPPEGLKKNDVGLLTGISVKLGAL